MYAQFFGLNQEPFSIAPDPRYLFMSERHREALAHLLYGLRGGGGFVLLSGEIGAGKTTVCRCFLEQIPKRCNVAYIFNPKLTVRELLKTVCDEFRIPFEHQGPGTATVKDYVDPLNEFLLKMHAVGRNNVLIIDEAQNLSADVLEQLRLLTNLETSERKLLQVILIGQPELRTMLARPELEQLAQRVIARFHLEALTEAETAQYIRHRLSVAGLTRPLPFDKDALRQIHRVSRGVPRRINLLCDRAMLGAYSAGRPRVDRAIVDKAALEAFDTPPSWWSRERLLALPPPLRWGIGAGVVVAVAAVLAWQLARPRHEAPATAVAAAASTAAITIAASTPARAPAAAADLRTVFSSAARNEREAWRELAPLWKLAPTDGDPCQAAARQQVQCWRSGGSNLAQIRQLGRPGILTLQDETDTPVYVLLTGLGEQNATLTIAGQPRELPLSTLARIWRGDFATLWRSPPGYPETITAGSAGPLVNWLAVQLASTNGQPAPKKKRSFDDALRAELAAFQRAQGLTGDGVPGPTTFMQLNRASGADEPRLSGDRAAERAEPSR